MSAFDNFKVGQRVAHINCGDGVVTAVGQTVDVIYDRKTSRGEHWRGSYDRDWFRINPGFLFHRSKP